MDLDAFVSSSLNLTGGRLYKDVVIEARALITDRNRWCQGAMARSIDWVPVRPRDARAARWSLMGAVAYCSNELGIIAPALLRYMDGLVDHLFPDGKFGCAGDFNDYFDHGTVLWFMDLAITRWDSSS